MNTFLLGGSGLLFFIGKFSEQRGKVCTCIDFAESRRKSPSRGLGKPLPRFSLFIKETFFIQQRKMEITLEAIISLVGLLLGGGGGAFFTWRYMRRKAKAEAEQAETEAQKEKQDYYQQLLEDLKTDREDRKAQNDELRAERDHYKQERNELRDRLDQIDEQVRKMRNEYSKEKAEQDRKIAQLGRRVELMRPFMCADLKCKKRQLVTTLESAAAEKVEPDEIEPYNGD